MDPDGVIRLVGKILRGVPSLPLAACRGRSELFDDVAWEDPAGRTARLAAAGGCAATALNGTTAGPAETKIPIEGPAQVGSHFRQDHR